jgi:predicted ATP-binding protein involved in virulence
MRDVFITKIHIDKVRHLQNVDITLSEIERRHLILTGKNGSGKTSLLEAMEDCILLKQREKASQGLDAATRDKIHQYLYGCIYSRKIDINPGVDISYSDDNISFLDVMFAYLSAGRNKLTVPISIQPVDVQGKTIITRHASTEFLQYILSLDYQLYGAKTNKDTQMEANLEKWFDNFQQALREIYGCPELKIQRDTKNLVFKVDVPGREPFGLHEMSDGYAAFLDIFMELLMRLENADAVVEYEQPAIVLIDEIETHLHVELQKRVLPFLTKMFPNVQFITATHSPFVITSLSNAVVFDLEKNEQLENPSFYSYETVVESFLDTDMYSEQLKSYFGRYRELCFKERTAEENDEFLRTKAELEIMARPSTELYIAFQELENKRKSGKR